MEAHALKGAYGHESISGDDGWQVKSAREAQRCRTSWRFSKAAVKRNGAGVDRTCGSAQQAHQGVGDTDERGYARRGFRRQQAVT